jgi:serine phosphatase RsbU (regulator of sigma subunit)/anti-sigma regulatory factor (Ser/Thr protein kinase)
VRALTRDEIPEGDSDFRPVSRAFLARYGFAVVAASASLATMGVFAPLTEDPVYALLVGAVAVTVWYGGFGPGLLVVFIGWTVSFGLFVGEPESVDGGTDEEILRWAASLLVALGVVWVSFVMRRGRERAGMAAVEAEASVRQMSEVQELATALSAALTPSDVAHELIQRAPPLLGARGGSLGLIERGELVIVDPRNVGMQTHAPGFRLPLSALAPIVQAAASDSTIVVRDRETFERDYPDGAALTLYAHGALAVPVRVAGEVVGSMSFLYDAARPPHEDAEAIAGIAADLGGQALERARLYAREREAREAFDRVLQVAPRFVTDAPETATATICREARATFGADVAMLWRLDGDELELMNADPEGVELPPGLVVELAEFPRLREAVEALRVSFVPDVQQEAAGAGLVRVRRLGIHSSLRTPISVGAGDAALVLIVSWSRVLQEPDQSVYALARRFGDQAGLALEQVERRRAEEEAAGRAEETRRLQAITAALSVAATAADVSDTCLEHALEAVGAEAGFVVLTHPEGVTVDIVTSSGFEDDELAAWAGYALDVEVPFARAIATGEAIWALTAEEMASFGSAAIGRDRGWAALPLRTPAGIRGALHLSFRSPRELSEGERRWLQTVVSQCAQALERSRLYDAEQLLRVRSERLQNMTAALANALSRQDVADVAVHEVGAAVGADATALAVVVEERGLLRTVAYQGFEEYELDEGFFELPLDAAHPAIRTLRRRVSTFYETADDLHADFPGAGVVTGHESFLYMPLVVGRRSVALLVLSWAEPHVLSADERRFVEALGGQAAQALDRATHFEAELTIAETLQRSVLPVSLPRVEGVQLAARYLPGTAELDVGGDWFDAIRLPGGRVGLVVGDVVGKGVQAASTMAQLRNALRAFSLDRLKPSTTIARLNRLAEETVETAFATIVYVVVDPAAQVCRITSAGHPPPLVAYPDGRVELLEGGRGVPLGAGPDTKYRHDVFELPVGTVLLLYSDGLVERRGRAIDEGLDELRRAAADGPREPEELVEHILERLVGDAERGDDIALLAMRLMTVAPQPLRLRVPSTTDSLDFLRDALRTWLAGAPLSRLDAHDVVLAAWEACANAIEHAVEPGADHVDVRVDIVDGRVRVSVEDTGRWLPTTDREDRGLGLRLIYESMSSVEIAPGDSGTRVTFEKELAEATEPEPSQ